MPKRISAVILNYNGLEDTVACLASIERAGYRDLAVVLVDNASPDGSGAALRDRYTEHTVILRSSNDGFAAGMNAGISHALEQGAEYILVMNNDVVVEPGFLDGMRAQLDAHPSTGMATCKAYLTSDPSRRYMTGGRLSHARCNSTPLTEAEAAQAMRVPFISGCIFLARAEVFRDVGLMDESFFLYFEDLEFARRVAKRWELWYLPDGVVHHKSGGGTGWSAYTATYHYYMNRNRFLAYRGDHVLLRLYVVLYSVVNTLAKTAVIALSRHSTRTVRGNLSALWRGLRDGIHIFFIPADAPLPGQHGRPRNNA